MAPSRIFYPQPALDSSALDEVGLLTVSKQRHALWRFIIRSASEEDGWQEEGWREEELRSGMRENLPNEAYMRLCSSGEFAPVTSRIVDAEEGGGATKLGIRLADEGEVETVIIYHGSEKGTGGRREDEEETSRLREPSQRATVCISSQIGCRMGCTFCATGTMGLSGNLTSGEILEQVIHARKFAKNIRNVVFMGMGEPFDNYTNVLSAVRALTSPEVFGLSSKHVTVSTVGVVPRMLSFARETPLPCNLALSLHAPTQALRLELVPSARAYSMEKLMTAVDEYVAVTKKGIMVQYILIRGVNDQTQHAEALGRLLEGRCAVLNLIPYNPTETDRAYEAPEDADIAAFSKVIRERFPHILVTLRKEMGQKVTGACGQLALKRTGGKEDRQGSEGKGNSAIKMCGTNNLIDW